MPNNTALSFNLGGIPTWQAFFLELLLKAMIQRLPGAVIFVLSLVQQFKRFSECVGSFAPLLPTSEQWSRIFSFFFAWENLYVPSLTLWSEGVQQHWGTSKLWYKQKKLQWRNHHYKPVFGGIAPLWIAKTSYLVLCLLLRIVLSLDTTSSDSLHAKMHSTFFHMVTPPVRFLLF